jgi:hypothetical protein
LLLSLLFCVIIIIIIIITMSVLKSIRIIIT